MPPKIPKICLNCGINFISTHIDGKYCSRKCQKEYEQKQWELKWLSGEISGNTNSLWKIESKHIKTYLINKYNNKCSKCGWGEVNQYTNKVPLEVEHIDGNPYNNRPENVTLLCPNCHSLTQTYRGANKGHGRGKTWIPKQVEIAEDIFEF